MGSISKRVTKSGIRYRVVADLGTEHGTGKRLRRSQVVETLREARALLAQWSVETAPAVLTRRTVGDFAQEWLDFKAGSVEASTLQDYRWNVERHILPALGALSLRELATTHIAAFLAGKTRGGLSSTSVRKLRGILVQLCAHAVDVGLLTRNAADLTKPPRRQRYEHTTWEAPDIRRFLEATSRDQMYPIWSMALLMGLRRGELLGLRWRDVDFEHEQVSIRRTVRPVLGRKSESGTKNVSSRRQVPMPAYVAAVLRAQQATQRGMRERAGNKWTEHGLVFTSTLGQCWHPDYVSRTWHDSVAALGLPQMRLHDARHTAATHLLEAGVSLPVVSGILGHVSTRTTTEVYAHALRSAFDEAAGKMSERIFPREEQA